MKLLIALISLFAASVHAAPPNIVIIFIDDMGYADIGPFGATKQKTPRLDRMAKEGMKLTNFYAAPVCSVSRAQLLTGCYGARVSVPAVYFPGGKNGLNPSEKTIAEYLKDKGYATACIGKWHVGDQPEFLPTKQGFDRYFGIPYSNDMQYKAVGGTERVSPLLRDDKVVEMLTDEQQSSIVERYTDEATRFIREKKDGPFFLYFPHNAIHTPIHPGAAFSGKSANGRVGDWVEEVDWSVGRVLDTLRDEKLDENTLVLFTSDNGPWLVKAADGGSALPLRGGKGSTWEGGVRVPTIARWPGKIAPGSVCDAVAGTIDLLPTAAALAGATVPAEPVIDGRDISPLLFGKSTQSPREAHYYFLGYTMQAVRQGPWKLSFTPQAESMSKETPADSQTNPRLYNLDAEIGERTNVADKHPEIVAKLQSLADKMNAEIGGKSPTARRPAGEVANPKTLYPIEHEKPRGKSKPDAAINELKPGAVVPADEAPRIVDHAFTVECTVETQQPDAVIVAHGGALAGYALHIRGGKPVFTIRYGSGEEFEEITGSEAIAGATKLIATLAADRSLSLSANGKVVASGKSKSLIPRLPAEDLSVGHDAKVPVANYATKAMFEGTITGLRIHAIGAPEQK
jgi:arylsulfatase A